MSTKRAALTPYIITFGAQTSHYQLATMERLRVSHHGVVMVRVQRFGEEKLFSVSMAACWALPADEAMWANGQRLYQIYQHTLTELAGLLRILGTYDQERERRLQFKELGAFANPIAPTAILAPLPDAQPGYVGVLNKPPLVRLVPMRRHTKKMIVEEDGNSVAPQHRLRQSQVIYCPDPAAWERVAMASQASLMASTSFEQYLMHLGIYADRVQHTFAGSA